MFRCFEFACSLLALEVGFWVDPRVPRDRFVMDRRFGTPQGFTVAHVWRTLQMSKTSKVKGLVFENPKTPRPRA